MLFRYSFALSAARGPWQYLLWCALAGVSIYIHDIAQEKMANWLEDRPLDKPRGAILDPLYHLPGIPLVMLLISGLVWGSAPFDLERLRGRSTKALAVLAGPAANILIAIAAFAWLSIRMRMFRTELTQVENGVFVLGVVNVALVIFNLIPCPPLDGAHLLRIFSNTYARLLPVRSRNWARMLPFMLIFTFVGPFIILKATSIAIRMTLGHVGFGIG
jgi:hypothetical protein